jgi:uncharacterized membrane protein
VLGAIAGLVIVSNLLKWLMHHHEAAMAGLLLGVLWGSAISIWPRQAWSEGLLLPCIVALGIGFVAVWALTLIGRDPRKETAGPESPKDV